MFGALFKPRLILLVLSVPLLLLMFPLTVFANSSFGEAVLPGEALNWSGYVDQGTVYSDVVGSWNVPSARCSRSETSSSAFWVGLGGVSPAPLEQIGTETDCFHGRPIYYAWYEMLPAQPFQQRLSSTNFNVQPGASIHAEVTYMGRGIFVLTLRDSTLGWRFQVREHGPIAGEARGTAEWVAEATAVKGRIAPLTNFGRVYFYGCFAEHKSISNGPTTVEVTMKKRGLTEAKPSGLGSSGTAFNVTWYRS